MILISSINLHLRKHIICLIIHAILSFIAWNFYGILFLGNLFIFFYLFYQLKNEGNYSKILIPFSYFLILNITSTFWLLDVDFKNGIITFFTNTILMSVFYVPFLFFLKKSKYSSLILILIWVFGEWILTKWDLAWPWLNFGNVLGNMWYLIQWYSFLGVYGGTLWLLLFANSLYQLIVFKMAPQKYILFVLLILPIQSIIAYYMPNDENLKTEKISCYVPENEKSSYKKTKTLLESINKTNASLVITPELFYCNTYATEFSNGDLSSLFKTEFKLKKNAKFVFGTEIQNDSVIKFNGITYLDNKQILFRTKKKYVPVTEFTHPFLVPFFGRSYYTKNNNDDSRQIKKSINSFPFVCYEILFSDFVAKNSLKTNKIILLASEAFLNDSEIGKKQYLNLVRLRAIENNKTLIKCSYKGISCVVSPKGKILKHLKEGINTETIEVNDKTTPYHTIIKTLHFL